VNLLTIDGIAVGQTRRDCETLIRERHYLRSIPSGKSHYVRFEDAVIVWSIPANMNIGRFLLGKPSVVWELSRMWAPDGHRPNLLTQAIAFALAVLKEHQPECVAVVSYADPNVGHTGGVYKAASWHPCGQCEESRYYVSPAGLAVARRAFHSGRRIFTKAEIEAMGYRQQNRPGKLRFAHGLKKWSRREIVSRFHVARMPADTPRAVPEPPAA
jgi:hypothetical protein